MPRLFHAFLIYIVWLGFPSLFSVLLAQSICPVPSLNQVNYVYPYRALVVINFNGASGCEAEVVPSSQTFTGQPNAANSPSSSSMYFYGLEPNTAYIWRMRGVCGGNAGNWGPTYNFTTPPPCPPAPLLELDSLLTMNFPADPSPNIGYTLCWDLAEEGSGSYVWGLKAPVSGTYHLQIVAASGDPVLIGQSSAPHPDCRGIYQTCLDIFGSPAGASYPFSLQTGDSIYFGCNFPNNSGTASLTVKFTKSPCLVPTLREVDSIWYTTARLDFNDNQPMDIEFVLETDSFTGNPNYQQVSNFLHLDGLMPGTGYKWRIRSNCFPVDSSTWLPGVPFETAELCDSIPFAPCGQPLLLRFKPGKGPFYFGEYPTDGREILLKYRPERSDFIKITVNQPNPPQQFLIAVRDSAEANCHTGSWAIYRKFYNTPHTVPIAYLHSDRTYYFLAEHAGYDSLNVQLEIHCPDICPAPIQLNAEQIEQTKATLEWQNNELSNVFEIEFRPLTDTFTGFPTHNGTGNSLDLNSLQALREYHWRVRNVCSGGVEGTWSAASEFVTMPYCGGGPNIFCGDTATVSNTPGFDYLEDCGQIVTGTERYFKFTPPYDGVFTINVTHSATLGFYGFLLKTADLGCEPPNWNCLGIAMDAGLTISTGYLEGGQPYHLAVNRPNYTGPGDKLSFSILCPMTCVAPDSLYSVDVHHESAVVGWRKLSNDESWELEVVEAGQTFTGVPNYFPDTTSSLLTGLLPTTNYQWRVRALCGAFGQSDWSTVSTFKTTMNCAPFPPLQCGQAIDLFFAEGPGYYQNMGGCGSPLSGSEMILAFTMDDNSTLRHLYFPQTANLNKVAIFYKDVTTGFCPGPAGSWICKAANPNYPIFYFDNLLSGHTYQILIKKRVPTGTAALPVIFYCDLPCNVPVSPSTQISPGTVKLLWDLSPGPWHFEIALTAANGSYSTLNSNVANGANALSWAALQPDSLYDWQVRRVCDTGDTSNWIPGPRFRAPFNCLGAVSLACDSLIVQDFPAGADYDFENACAVGTSTGQFQLYKITPGLMGEHLLRIHSAGGAPFHYALTQSPANCSGIPTPWFFCQDIAATGDFSLGNLNANQTYYLQVSKTGVASGMQVFQLLCPCPAVTDAQGILYADGSVTLDWTPNAAVESWEIEILPVDSMFDGIGTYETSSPPMIVPSLDASAFYKFRIRSRCAGTTSAWTDSTGVEVYPNCVNFPIMTCADTLLIDIAHGNGLFDHQPCDQSTPGREAYFKIRPSYTGFQRLKMLSSTGAASGGWLSDCGDPNSNIDCINSTWNEGIVNLGYLQSDQTYTIVMDAKFLFGANYLSTYACDLPPANDENNLWWSTPYYVITVNDSCQTFTNSFATPNPSEDPDPSQAPGNWHDGPEHSVWFGFTAPPGGTVQITANSDPDDPMDPQIALLQLDSTSFPWTFVVLATGEDQPSPDSQNAVLNFTGLIPGATYAVLVDGAYGSEGRFCLKITDEPLLSTNVDVCESYTATAASSNISGWINLYAENDNPHINGPLLAALKTTDNLGDIAISTIIKPEVPVLSGVQKVLPRYFNIDTEFAPQAPVQVRLFFTPDELANFNLALPPSSVSPADLSITHYDGGNEDCDPTNNNLPTGVLATQPTNAVYVGENGLFYLETTVSSFSELGGSLPEVVGTQTQIAEIGLQVFPNPFSRQLELRLHAAHGAILQGKLWNMTGQAVWTGEIAVAPGNSRQIIVLEEISPGVYQLSLNGEGCVVARALVVKM